MRDMQLPWHHGALLPNEIFDKNWTPIGTVQNHHLADLIVGAVNTFEARVELLEAAKHLIRFWKDGDLSPMSRALGVTSGVERLRAAVEVAEPRHPPAANEMNDATLGAACAAYVKAGDKAQAAIRLAQEECRKAIGAINAGRTERGLPPIALDAMAMQAEG